MEATLTWLDLTSTDREKLRQILDLFNEKGTIDEMGLATIRDLFADALFPGLNTFQTRLKYVLFVPWMYQILETRGSTTRKNIDVAARKFETDLIQTLEKHGEKDGVIGTISREKLGRLPSSIYWTALKLWKILSENESQPHFHQNFNVQTNRPHLTEDDPGAHLAHQSRWHARLPRRPEAFPSEASFDLTSAEADFIRGRLEETCGSSLIGWLAANGSRVDADLEDFWKTSATKKAPNRLREVIELARRFSLHVEGMPLLYNLLIAERRIAKGLAEDSELFVTKYRELFGKWAVREKNEDRYDPSNLVSFAALRNTKVYGPQLRFIERWSERVAQVEAADLVDDSETRNLIEYREFQLKKNRARLQSIDRLRDWNDGVGVGRMDFRWNIARRLLKDLYSGLAADSC